MRRRGQTTLEPNQQVGSWTLLTYQAGHRDGDRRVKARWLCRCECGVLRSVLHDNLASGQSTGCGHDSQGGRGRTNYVPANSVFALGGPPQMVAPRG